MTIAEVSKKYNLTQDTIRYYERIGLIPQVPRTKAGIRDFDEHTCKWIEFIKCMRAAGMSIEALIKYVDLFKQGKETVTERKKLLIEQKEKMQEKPRTPYRVTVRGLVGGREWIREPRTEKQSPGLFFPACGRSCCSHLTLSSHKPRTPYRETVRGLVGGREWIRTTEVVDGRFTVCSLWPLGNSPIFNFCVAV